MITSLFCPILEIYFKTNIPNQSPQLKLNDTYIESTKQIQTTRPAIYQFTKLLSQRRRRRRQPRSMKLPKQKSKVNYEL